MKIIIMHLPFVLFIITAIFLRIINVPLVYKAILIVAVIIYGVFFTKKSRSYFQDMLSGSNVNENRK